jgi:DNA-binding response OmpR family regulator
MHGAKTHVLVAGVEPLIAQELSDYLESRSIRVTRVPDANQTYDLVFCQSNHPELPAWLKNRRAPVVVVSRTPDVNDWLDAMDAGAADYCAAPFESQQLDWILQSNLHRLSRAA